MFAWSRRHGEVEIAVTDRTLDLRVDDERGRLASTFGVDAMAAMRQVHGADVAWVSGSDAGPPVEADALVTEDRGLGLLVRVADCVPVVLAAPGEGMIGVVHSGRAGLVLGVVPAAVSAMRGRGATAIEAWIGPHVCGSCYELPADMAADVAAAVPAALSTTSWGTPAADLGAGVAAQLSAADVMAHDASACTREDERFFSHRRGDGGRFGMVAVLR